MSLPRNNSSPIPHRLSLGLGLLGMATAITVLLGWRFDIDVLTTLGLSNTIFMAPNTALCLLIGSAAVWLVQRPLENRYTRFLGKLGGALVFLFSAAVVYEYWTITNLGIDTVFMRSRIADWTATATPGRFAFQTAVALAFIGAGLVLLDVELSMREVRLSELCSGMGLLIGFLGVIGHAYGVRSLYGVMALHTAVSIAVLSAATLLARSHAGVVGLFFSSNAAGVALRRTLLTSLLALTFFGWVAVYFLRHSRISVEGATSLLVLASVFFVCGLLIRTSFALKALEQEREETRRALFESEARYRSIFEYSKEGIALYEPVLDDSGTLVDWVVKDANASFVSGSGLDRVRIIGHRLTEMFGPREALAVYLNAAREVYQSGKARQFEAYLGPLGRYYIVSIFPIADRLFASTTIDITKSKQAEQLVRESEARYRQIVETASEGIWMLDESMRVTFVNDRFARMLGYDPREMLGRRKFDFVFEEDAPFIQALFDSRRAGLRSSVDIRMKHRDGTERWMMMAAAPVMDSQGGFRGALDMFTDITERRAAVQALRNSEARFRELADSMPQMVWTAEADGSLTYSNRRYIQYTGRSAEAAAEGWLDSVHPEDVADADQRWMNGVISGQEVSLECRLRRASDGTYRWHLIRAVPTFDSDGRMARWYGTCTDIHENKLAEEAMMKSEKLAATGRLAATIAHEINNPLEAVTNLVFLAQNTAAPEQSREFLSLASEELQRVAHITKQTLGFYRETASPARMKMSSVLESVISLYERKIESKEIQVEKRFRSDVEIEAIPGEVRQVFSNLVSNAIDAMDSGGTLKIAMRAVVEGSELRGVRVIVADNGTGIPEDIRPQVFEPFFTTKRDFGTGLGLWVTRQIVRRHGGSIRVRSSASEPHRGTHFSVYFPAKAALEIPEAKLKTANA